MPCGLAKIEGTAPSTKIVAKNRRQKASPRPPKAVGHSNLALLFIRIRLPALLDSTMIAECYKRKLRSVKTRWRKCGERVTTKLKMSEKYQSPRVGGEGSV